MTDSGAEGAGAPSPGLGPPILVCLAATWLIWGSTYLAIKWSLISLPPFFQMGTRFLVAGAFLLAGVRLRGVGGMAPPGGWGPSAMGGAPLLLGGFGLEPRPPESGGTRAFGEVFICVAP